MSTMCLIFYSRHAIFFTRGEKMNIKTEKEIQEWIYDNLVDKRKGAEITGQSIKAFEQSVRLKYIKPFYENEGVGSSKIKLYKKSDLELYAKNKRK